MCHFPPGTSKWNKIEHRMFCHITQNWRGKPLVSQAVIVNLIGNTTTRTGLRVRAALDASSYEAFGRPSTGNYWKGFSSGTEVTARRATSDVRPDT